MRMRTMYACVDDHLPPRGARDDDEDDIDYYPHDDDDEHDECDDYYRNRPDDGNEYYDIEDHDDIGMRIANDETRPRLEEDYDDVDDRDGIGLGGMGRCAPHDHRRHRRVGGVFGIDDHDDNDDAIEDDYDYDYDDARRENAFPPAEPPPSRSHREYCDDIDVDDDDDDEGGGDCEEHGRRVATFDENDIRNCENYDDDYYDADEECDNAGEYAASSSEIVDLNERIEHQWSSEEEDVEYRRRGADVIGKRRRARRRHRDASYAARIYDRCDDCDGTHPHDVEGLDYDYRGGDAISDAFLPARVNVGRSSDSHHVIRRIESVMTGLVASLDGFESILRGYSRDHERRRRADDDDDDDDEDNESAVAHRITPSRTDTGDPRFYRNFDNIAQSRSFASICCVMSFIHQLLLSNRTTTTREVYYVFVTHFRNQRECDDVILDVARALGVSRRSLGLSASPKGWFCGCVEIERRGRIPTGKDVSGTIDGTALLSVQGLPITREWTELDECGRTEDGVEIKITSKRARAILVIEKEGVYNRLSEERIYDRFPCILVTGKGYPDLATRALVSALHRELEIPVIGLCDCNPYGISVLAMYHCAGDRMGIDGRRRYTVPIQWLGLRPSVVEGLKKELPETVFQKLTDLDCKRIASLLDSENRFLTEEDEEEVRIMGDSGYKVELEALYWLGPDHMGNWVVEMLKDNCDHA